MNKEQKQIIAYLEENFGTCEPPFVGSCTGCMATQLVEIIKDLD